VIGPPPPRWRTASHNAATPKLRADKNSAEPGTQVFVSFKIMNAKGGRSEKLSIRMRNPRNWQLIAIHVRFHFFNSSRGCFFAKNGIPLFKELLRQLRDVFRMLNQIADRNSVHGDTYGAHFSEGTAKGSTIG
jgi:hypothetical protein